MISKLASCDDSFSEFQIGILCKVMVSFYYGSRFISSDFSTFS